MRKAGIGIFIGILLVTGMLLHPSKLVHADDISDLQQKIDANNNTIKQLQTEIAQYQTQLTQTSSQAKTLQTAVQALDTNSKKLGADISVTQNKIGTADLSIQQLGLEINDKQSKITTGQKAVANLLRTMNQSDSQSFMTTLLLYPNISTFWDEVDTNEKVQNNIKNRVEDLRGLTQGLIQNKSDTEAKKTELEQLKDTLADQQKVIEVNKQQKASLLAQTKSQETAYKQIIADKQAKESAFEKDLEQYEAQLKLKVDPGSFPTSGNSVLSWPLDKHIITQYFGNTEFAQAHAAVYNGNGHNGIDLGTPIGTPVKAALDGVIKGTGNTDLTCPGASYGMWVMIQHPNGLSTLYAHLSVIKAVTGQSVTTGDVIGYSGVTGYATGPHLHFTVYATQGVEIISRPSVACGGKIYTLPVADLKAYLNPLNYLPTS